MIACVDSPHCCSGRVLGVALSWVRYPVWESAAETIGPASTIQGLEPDSLRHAAAAHRLPSLHTDSLLQPTSGSARASHAPEKKFTGNNVLYNLSEHINIICLWTLGEYF